MAEVARQSLTEIKLPPEVQALLDESIKDGKTPEERRALEVQAIKKMMDPNDDRTITTQEALATAKLNAPVIKYLLAVDPVRGKEVLGTLEKATPEEIAKQVKDMLGLDISPESAQALKEATINGAKQSSGGFVMPEDMKNRLRERFDTNKNDTLDATEVAAAAKRIRQETSILKPEDKAKLKLQGEHLSEEQFGQKFAEALGLKIDKESAVIIAKAYREGLDSEPDNELLAERERARRAAGKDGKEKDWFEMLMDLLKPILVSMGFMREDKPEASPPPPATQTAGATPPPVDSRTSQIPLSSMDPATLAASRAEGDALRATGSSFGGSAVESPAQLVAASEVGRLQVEAAGFGTR